jgi:hypothetical protein
MKGNRLEPYEFQDWSDHKHKKHGENGFDTTKEGPGTAVAELHICVVQADGLIGSHALLPNPVIKLRMTGHTMEGYPATPDGHGAPWSEKWRDSVYGKMRKEAEDEGADLQMCQHSFSSGMVERTTEPVFNYEQIARVPGPLTRQTLDVEIHNQRGLSSESTNLLGTVSISLKDIMHQEPVEEWLPLSVRLDSDDPTKTGQSVSAGRVQVFLKLLFDPKKEFDSHFEYDSTMPNYEAQEPPPIKFDIDLSYFYFFVMLDLLWPSVTLLWDVLSVLGWEAPLKTAAYFFLWICICCNLDWLMVYIHFVLIMVMISNKSRAEKKMKEVKPVQADTVTVTVLEARNLVSMDSNGLSDPYVIIRMGKTKKKAATRFKTLNPKWTKFNTFTFHMPPHVLHMSTVDKKDLMTIEAQIRDYDSVLVSEFMGLVKIDTSSSAFPIGTVTEGWYSLNELTGGTDCTAPQTEAEAEAQAAKEEANEEANKRNKPAREKVTGQIKLQILLECRVEPETTVESLVVDVDCDLLSCVKTLKVKACSMSVYPIVHHLPKMSKLAKERGSQLAMIEKQMQLTHVNQNHTAHMHVDRVRQILSESVAKKPPQSLKLTFKWISRGHVQDMLNQGSRDAKNKDASVAEEGDYQGDMTIRGGGKQKMPAKINTGAGTPGKKQFGSPALSPGSNASSPALSPTGGKFADDSQSKTQMMHSMAYNIEDRADYHLDGTTSWLLNSLLGGNGDNAESMEAIFLGVQINLAFVSSMMQMLADMFEWKNVNTSWGLFAGLCVSALLHCLFPNRWIWLVICVYLFIMWNPTFMDYERRLHLWLAAKADAQEYTALKLSRKTMKDVEDGDRLREQYTVRETQQMVVGRKKKRTFFGSNKKPKAVAAGTVGGKAGDGNRGGLWEPATPPIVRYSWSDERGGTFRTKKFVEMSYVRAQSAAQRQHQIDHAAEIGEGIDHSVASSASPQRSSRTRSRAGAVNVPMKKMAWIIRGASSSAELQSHGLGPEGWHYGRNFSNILASSQKKDGEYNPRPFVNGDTVRSRVWEWKEVDRDTPLACAAAADRSRQEMEFEMKRVNDMVVAANMKTQLDEKERIEFSVLRVQTRWRAKKGLLATHMVRNAKRQIEREREQEKVVKFQAICRSWLACRAMRRLVEQKVQAKIEEQERADREEEEAFMGNYSCMPSPTFLRFRPCKQ